MKKEPFAVLAILTTLAAFTSLSQINTNPTAQSAFFEWLFFWRQPEESMDLAAPIDSSGQTKNVFGEETMDEPVSFPMFDGAAPEFQGSEINTTMPPPPTPPHPPPLLRRHRLLRLLNVTRMIQISIFRRRIRIRSL